MSEEEKKIVKKKIKLKVTKPKPSEEEQIKTKEKQHVDHKINKEDHLKMINEKVKKELESKKTEQNKPSEFRRFKRFDSKDKKKFIHQECINFNDRNRNCPSVKYHYSTDT